MNASIVPAHRLLAPSLLLLLAGCPKPAPSATPGDAGATATMAGSGAGPSTSAAGTAATRDAAAATGPCTYALPAAPASIEKTPAPDLARAIIPSLDPRTMKAKPLPAGPIVDCLDDPAENDWSGHDPPVPAKGHVEVALRQPISGERELVWVMTGYPQGACSTEDGFVAIEHLEGAVVVADAVGKWTASCGKPTRMRVVKLGGEEMYTEDSAFGTGAGRNTTEMVWAVKGKRMVEVGEYDVAADSGGVEDEQHWLFDMKAKPEFDGNQIVVRETWTWTSTLAVDGGGGPKPKSKVNLRKFVLEGGKLKAVTAEGPPAMP